MEEIIDETVSSVWMIHDTILSSSLIVSILMLIILIIFIPLRKNLNDKSLKAYKRAKILFLVSALLFVLYSIFLFVYYFGLVNNSGFCGFIGNLNEGNTRVLDELKVDI